MSKKKKSKIEYGDVDLPKNAFDSRYSKVRISMMVPEDVVLAFKRLAEERGTKYQTLMNEVLRRYIDSEEGPTLSEDAIRAMVQEEIGKHLEANQ